MEAKIWMIFLTALVPLAIGSIYYSKAVAGKLWMQVTGMTDEKAQQGNMLKIFGLTYLFGVMLSFMLMNIVIHQMGVFGVFQGTDYETVGSKAHELYHAVMDGYGHNFRTFGHGTIHGMMTAIFLIWPVIAINALFEQRGWKYVAIHTIYWLICCAIIGGILCAWV